MGMNCYASDACGPTYGIAKEGTFEPRTLSGILRETETILNDIHSEIKRMMDKLDGTLQDKPCDECVPQCQPPLPGICEQAAINLKQAYFLRDELMALVDRL